jgi:hypothetical protein
MGLVPRYACTSVCSIRTTEMLGEVMDRAPRPYTAGELAEITGLPIRVVKSFLLCNARRGRLSARLVPRRDLLDSGKPQKEYWRGGTDVFLTFGRADMITKRQAQEMASGRRPMEWRGEQATVWSIDETDTLAVRRGNTVLCLGRVDGIELTDRGVAVRIGDGSRMEFAAKDTNTKKGEKRA